MRDTSRPGATRRRCLLHVARRLVVLAACSMGTGCSRGIAPALLDKVRRGVERVALDAPVDVPLVGGRLRPIVEVTINGRGPYRFLVDVGANVVSVRESVAREVGASVVQRLSTRSVARLDSLRFGAALLRDVFVVGEPKLDVDGVIGFNVFRDGLLTIDYVRQRLAWRAGALPPADGQTVLDYQLRDRMPYVEVTIGPLSRWFNLDTGASGSLIVPRALEAQLPLADSARAGVTLWNQAEGAIPMRSATLRGDVALGAHVVPSPVVLFSPALDDEYLIGSALLQRLAVTFDLAGRRVQFARDTTSARRDTTSVARDAGAAGRDSAFLDSLLVANRYPIALDGGRLTGPGAALLVDASASAQFVVVGESHNVAEIPRFVTALFDTLQRAYGFHYLATENGAEIMRAVATPPARGRADSVFALARRYPHAFEFWNDQELESLAAVGRLSRARSQPIWGLDQEFGATHVLDRLAAIAPTRAARSAVVAVADSARRVEVTRPFGSGSYRRWIDGADSATWTRLRDAFRPSRDPEAARLIDALALSNRLYRWNALGRSDSRWYYESNAARERYISEQFVRHYRAAESASGSPPRVVVKVGSVHGGDWLNDLGVHALGETVRGVAAANGRTSLHVIAWLVNEPGQFWTLGDTPAYAPVARAGSPHEWVVLDVRPLRAQTYSSRMGALSREMRDVVFAYDAVLLIGGGTRATYARLAGSSAPAGRRAPT